MPKNLNILCRSETILEDTEYSIPIPAPGSRCFGFLGTVIFKSERWRALERRVRAKLLCRNWSTPSHCSCTKAKPLRCCGFTMQRRLDPRLWCAVWKSSLIHEHFDSRAEKQQRALQTDHYRQSHHFQKNWCQIFSDSSMFCGFSNTLCSQELKRVRHEMKHCTDTHHHRALWYRSNDVWLRS